MFNENSERKQVDPGAAESVKRATRSWHAVAAALAPRLKGLNITTDLMQVGKVVTGQQL